MYFQVQDKEPRLTERKKSLYKDSQRVNTEPIPFSIDRECLSRHQEN